MLDDFETEDTHANDWCDDETFSDDISNAWQWATDADENGW